MDTSKQSICEGMIIAMEYATNARDIVEIICDFIQKYVEEEKEKCDLKKIQAVLFLINDILFNTSCTSVPSVFIYK